MPYLYEHLGPERFQKFCQALLVVPFPGLQSFPVGQPDGGRDGATRVSDDTVGPTVAQVKFKRKDEAENAEWMIDALEKELPKIEKLIARGAKRYVMVTNARGTAHQDVGSIDKVQKWFVDNVSIEAMCLWRDDLDAHVDSADARLKMSYPDLLTGNDALTIILHSALGPHKDRIDRVLRGFVAEQYRLDKDVKFRQVNLSNSLLGLFVDVPVTINDVLYSGSNSEVTVMGDRLLHRLGGRLDVRTSVNVLNDRGEASEVVRYQDVVVGTADFLLDPDVQSLVPWVILQGGPGQGKSTLAQYVCQVHRANYLGKEEFQNEVIPSHRETPFRLPIKVDLRDFANYLDGRPFLGQVDFAHPTPFTLERFLAALIHTQSGGLEFTPDDLAEVLSVTPVLLFLDGLDEVADLKLRENLINRVVEGLGRLQENRAEIQVVITSRPSLFGRNPALTKANFKRLDLAPIMRQTIDLYADKWIVARGIDAEEGSEVKSILGAKLGLAHIRELTRNPMQLTILLSLIHSVGYSLPDVRTDLYRQYVELFMTREAEKSPIVREHRQLLLEIVQHLAWTLQVDAESQNSAGSITRDDLRALISEYLVRGEHPTDILDDLFTGGLERVYVLVQRIEGLYEFEVQPLREYFTARHLFATAPVGTFRHQDLRGDRAQRFEALLKNPYWSNVTRFYAGSYESGDLGALLTSLKEVIGSTVLAESINARSAGAALLTDWVFRAKKSIQREVVEVVFDPLGVDLASLSLLEGFQGPLDPACGSDELAKVIFESHVQRGNLSTSSAKVEFLRLNGGHTLGGEFLSWIRASDGDERSKRVAIAFATAATQRMRAEDIEDSVYSDDPTPIELRRRLMSGLKYDPLSIDRSAKLAADVRDSLLAWGGIVPSSTRNELAQFSELFSGELVEDLTITPLDESPGTPLGSERVASKTVREHLVDAFSEPVELIGDQQLWEHPERWSRLIERSREHFGEVWMNYRLAIEQCGLISAEHLMVGGSDLSDSSTPLFERAVLAQRWRGRPGWWAEQLQKLQTPNERLFWLGLILSWGITSHIRANQVLIENELAKLDEDDFVRLSEAVGAAVTTRTFMPPRMRTRAVPKETTGMSDRLLLLILYVASHKQIKNHTDLEGRSSGVVDLVARASRRAAVEAFGGWSRQTQQAKAEWLKLVRDYYEVFPRSQGDVLRESGESMPADVATDVLAHLDEYPRRYIESAFAANQGLHVFERLVDVAGREQWSLF